MKTYRIKECNYQYSKKQFKIERKSIFGFWYNPDNIDGEITGYHDTLESAERRIQSKLDKCLTKVIKIISQ